MARCSNDTLLNKLGVSKLTKQQEVSFTVLSDLPDCRKINTKNYIKYSGEDAPYFAKYSKPVNRFECERTGCINSGTLMLEGAQTVDYRVQYDAREFGSGAIALYVMPGQEAVYPIALTATISTGDSFANADVYTVSITADMVKEDGYAAIVIDLSQTPTSTVGEGWDPSQSGAYLRLAVDKAAGVSSVAVYDSIMDFETSDVVKVGCLSSVGGTNDVAALEATCLSAGYDDSISSIDYTITGNTVTPNYWKLNPLMGKGDAVESFEPVNASKTVEEYRVGGKTYGRVTLTDAYQEECGFYGVQVSDNCDVTGSSLTLLTIPTLIDLDQGHYQIIQHDDDGTTDIIMNAAFIGQDVIVAYPKRIEVEEFVASTDNIGTKRVKMAYPVYKTDGTKEIHIFENVLITSFPATIGTEETEFSFSVSIQKMADGRFFRVVRVLA